MQKEYNSKEKNMEKLKNGIFCKATMALLTVLVAVGCHHDDVEPETHVSQRTIIMFYPWTMNLKTFFEDNIDDFEDAIEEGILNDERVVVCFSTKPSEALLIEISRENGKCRRDTFATLPYPDFTKTQDISGMLSMVSGHAPARHYSMIAGGHGMAWLPAGYSPVQQAAGSWFDEMPLTRWFGDFTTGYQINISTLANGIRNAGIHLDYILFDDCYMSSVEVAYTIRDVTDYLIGCPSEIMIFGFPYYYCARYLVGNPNYATLCETFKKFYTEYEMPYGTVAVTDCHEVSKLAEIVRQINNTCTSTNYDKNDIQSMDGFDPPMFLDLGDTYEHLCADSAMLNSFRQQMAKTVPYKACTDSYYSTFSGVNKIFHYSGLTTSVICNSAFHDLYNETEWHKATGKY